MFKRSRSFAVLGIIAILAGSCSAQQIANVRPAPAGQITAIGTLISARASHSATLLDDGRVLVAGGMERNGVFFDTAEIFDSGRDRFMGISINMRSRRVSHTGTLLRDGRVLIAGGWSERNAIASTAEVYDPRRNMFVGVGSMQRSRAGHTSTLLDDGTVLIAGGFDGRTVVDEVEIFDPRTNSFTITGKLLAARLAHTATKLEDGRVVLSGGETTGGTILSSVEIFEPKAKTSTPLKTTMTTRRYKHDAILLKDGRILIWGGADERDWRGQYRSAETLEPATGEFKATADMNFTRFKVDGTSALLSDGRVLIAGGSDAAEVFDPRANTFAKANGGFDGPLHFASVTLLPDGRALIVGGYGTGTREHGPVSTNRAWIFRL